MSARELTQEEYDAVRERMAHHYLGITFAEFQDRWRAGEYRGQSQLERLLFFLDSS